MRRWLGLCGVAVTIGGVLACSRMQEPFCPNGVFPFDGQTGVGTDAIIVIQTGAVVPSDAPDLHDTVTLRQANRDVPFRLEVDGDTGELRIIPERPLSPGLQYEVGAVDWYALGEMPHWWGPSSFGRDYTITTFRTFSEPQLLGAYALPDQETLVAVFSEPVDLDSFDGRAWGASSSAPATTESGLGTEIPLSAIGYHDGDAHLVELVSTGADDMTELFHLRVDGGVEAATGERVPAGSEVTVVFEEGQLARYAGAPTCFFEF
ncbi:MAG: hypothetical protein KC621_18290 [Myxococcales bacterium]|nr:hypothetical protein [Myxococcales bacterium]